MFYPRHLLPLFLLWVSGCALFQQGEGESPTVVRRVSAAVPAEGLTLGPGDVFEVRVYEERDLTGEFMVGHDGHIDFPLVGRLLVHGLTPNQLSTKLREELGRKYLRNPQVTVMIKEVNSKKVFVFGQVRKPGTFTYQDRMSIVEAITLAGGFTNLAWSERIKVTRSESGADEQKFVVDVTQIRDGQQPNFQLNAGDIVFVPESLF